MPFLPLLSPTKFVGDTSGSPGLRALFFEIIIVRFIALKITAIGPNAELNFHANQTQLHVRTETWMMRFGQCMEVNFRVEGKRTRLLMYTCHMAEGGTCVLDKFLATTTLKQLDRANPFKLDTCHMLKPWLFPPSPFAFHFRFVRRPRKFADKAKALRHRRRRHGRHATREVGRVELHGFRDCEKACVTDGGGELEDIPLAGANYFEDPLQGWKRRKR
uniref:ZP domain-containing protein n=1 Tax=Globodera pallida TaxID=36090 RepID=A0A183BJ81_GLOPA